MVSGRKWVIVLGVLLAAPSALMARQAVLSNGSMESGAGPISEDPHLPAHWIIFGNPTERSDEANLVPPGDGHALKCFGGDPQVGAYQDVPAQPGDSVSISAHLYTRSGDKLGGDAQAGIYLEFYNDQDQLLDLGFVFVLDASSPPDTWIQGTVGPLTAPAGTVTARMVCVWRWFGSASGAAFWDDCQLTINGGDNLILNGDFETAGLGQQSPFGIDDWVGFNDQQKSEEQAFHGNSSVKLGLEDAYSGLWQDMTILEEGDRILLKARAMVTSNSLLGSAQVGIKLEFDPISVVPPPEENLPFDENATTNSWHLVQLSTTVPADITVARIIMIYVGDPQTTGAVYFDDASARLDGGGNQLFNESFEMGSGGGILWWTEFKTAGVSEARKNCAGIKRTGNCSMRATGQAVSGIFQEIFVNPGQTLDVSAYLYTPHFEKLTGTGLAGVKVEWSPGTVPPDIDIGGSNNTIDATDPEGVWHDLFIDFTMPAGNQALARFTAIIAKGTATGGAGYVDGCEAVVLNRFAGADADGDDDSDLWDFAEFQRCHHGSGVTPLDWACTVFDLDPAPNGDQDIDLADYDTFEQGFTGPLPPP
jgi:hypothetical protein